jgi:hypothetical protein
MIFFLGVGGWRATENASYIFWSVILMTDSQSYTETYQYLLDSDCSTQNYWGRENFLIPWDLDNALNTPSLLSSQLHDNFKATPTIIIIDNNNKAFNPKINWGRLEQQPSYTEKQKEKDQTQNMFYINKQQGYSLHLMKIKRGYRR